MNWAHLHTHEVRREISSKKPCGILFANGVGNRQQYILNLLRCVNQPGASSWLQRGCGGGRVLDTQGDAAAAAPRAQHPGVLLSAAQPGERGVHR